MIGAIIQKIFKLASLLASLTRSRYEWFFAKRRLHFDVETDTKISKSTLSRLIGISSPVILDVGAFDGGDSMEFAIMYPKGQIFAFESDLNNFRKLLNATQNFSNINVVFAAVSNECGVSRFYPSFGSSVASGSILKPDRHLSLHPSVMYNLENPNIVPMVSLDSYFNLMNYSSFDLIWIDVQGAEIRVLEGATKTLSKTRYIYAEVNSEQLYNEGTTYETLCDFLAMHRFSVLKEFMPKNRIGEGNILFERQR